MGELTHHIGSRAGSHPQSCFCELALHSWPLTTNGATPSNLESAAEAAQGFCILVPADAASNAGRQGDSHSIPD